MKFIISESGMAYLERMTYTGAIGLFYKNTLGAIAAYAIFGVFCILALIGLFTVLKWIVLKITGKKAHYF